MDPQIKTEATVAPTSRPPTPTSASKLVEDALAKQGVFFHEYMAKQQEAHAEVLREQQEAQERTAKAQQEQLQAFMSQMLAQNAAIVAKAQADADARHDLALERERVAAREKLEQAQRDQVAADERAARDRAPTSELDLPM